VVETEPRRDTLAFQVDLWSARGEFPRNIFDVMTRDKEIRYSSRTRAGTDQFKHIQKIRHTLAGLLEKLPQELKNGPEARLLGSVAERRVYNIVHLIYREFETESGRATVIDFMPISDEPGLVRIVVSRSGRIDFRTEFVARFNYGSTVPWVNRLDDGTINAIAGPERLVLRTPAALYGEDLRTLGEFTVEAGESVPFILAYGTSVQPPPPPIDAFEALQRTEASWRKWSDRCPDVGPWNQAVKRSLITLRL